MNSHFNNPYHKMEIWTINEKTDQKYIRLYPEADTYQAEKEEAKEKGAVFQKQIFGKDFFELSTKAEEEIKRLRRKFMNSLSGADRMVFFAEKL